jgi:Rab9 effector protein with kelch motifs
VRLRVSGTPPTPRYWHTANVSLSDIVYFGGWSINSGSRAHQANAHEIDYFVVLNTDADLRWEKGVFEGQPPPSRHGHTATSIGPHILIFGGWEYNRASG